MYGYTYDVLQLLCYRFYDLCLESPQYTDRDGINGKGTDQWVLSYTSSIWYFTEESSSSIPPLSAITPHALRRSLSATNPTFPS